MRVLALSLAVLALAAGIEARAEESRDPERFAVSLRAGGFDEQGSGMMARKDGEPGNPLIGWKGSEQIAAAVGFDVRPGLTLDLSLARLDFDIGSDLLITEPGAGADSTRIATGSLDELRFAVWLDPQILSDAPTYYVSAERKSRGRLALAFVGAVANARSVDVADAGREQLGVDEVAAGRQSALGFGLRLDYRLGRSRFTVGADLDWMWALSGDVLTLTTLPDSPYSGTDLAHEGFNFLVDLCYHF